MSIQDFFVKNMKKLIAISVAVAILLIGGIIVYGTINSARSGLINREVALTAQYKDNQNELSQYVLQFKETLGIADRQTDKLDKILTDAVKGRYDGNMTPGTGGSMFSAIAEAYPDLTSTTQTYAKVQDLVVSGREAYKNKQSKLLDMIRDYKAFAESDLFRSWIINGFLGGYPTKSLTVTDDGTEYVGAEALKKISQIVLVQDAVDSYKTGLQEPLIVPESSTPPAE